MITSPTGIKVRIQGFETMTSSGNPSLPSKSILIVLPQEADETSVTVSLSGDTKQTLPGTYEIAPVPPWKTEIEGLMVEDWGEGKQIVSGKNILVYGVNQFYPAQHVQKNEVGKMREKKIVRVLYCPFLYNPVTKTLVRSTGGNIVINYKLLTDSVNLLSSNLLEDVEKELLDNYEVIETLEKDSGKGGGNEAPGYFIFVEKDILALYDTEHVIQNEFVPHKTAKGFNVQIVTEEDWKIYDNVCNTQPLEHCIGDNAANAIRQYLRDNYSIENIKYVLFIGNPHPFQGKVPMKMLYPRSGGVDFFDPLDPEYVEWVNTVPQDKKSPSDFYYADLNDEWDWNADFDLLSGEYEDLYFCEGDQCEFTIDRLPEVLVGRIPFYGPPLRDASAAMAEVQGILRKMMAYERGETLVDPADPQWTRKILITTENFQDLDPEHNLTETYRLGNEIVDYIKSLNGSLDPDKIFKTTRISRDNPAPVEENHIVIQPPSYDTVSAEWNRNVGLHIWWGPGSALWATNIMRNNLVSRNLNNTHPSFVFAASPYNAQIDLQTNLANEILKVGSVSIIGAMSYTWHIDGQESFQNNTDAGLANRYPAKLIDQFYPNADSLYMIKSDLPVTSALEWQNLCAFNLLGDPALSYAYPEPVLDVKILQPTIIEFEGQEIYEQRDVEIAFNLVYTTSYAGTVRIYDGASLLFEGFKTSGQHSYDLPYASAPDFSQVVGHHVVRVELWQDPADPGAATASDETEFDVRYVFWRGDSNTDGKIDISDAVHALVYLFSSGPQPRFRIIIDNNDDEKVDISDAVYLLTYLFSSGPEPREPFDQRPGDTGSKGGFDPTPGVLENY